LVKLEKIPMRQIDAETVPVPYRQMIETLAEDLAKTIVPYGLFYENEKVGLIQGMLQQGHVEIAEECTLIIKETRNKYFKMIMREDIEGFDTTITGHELYLRVAPPVQINRRQAWGRMLGYLGPYPFDDPPTNGEKFDKWLEEGIRLNLNPQIAGFIMLIGPAPDSES
ncbi:MAG: hypothetical protein Q9214_005717, partial [Letrouitia sp. 1 TL-2023]